MKNEINFMYFGHNYPHDFISRVWKDNPNLAKHFEDKFKDMYQRYNTLTFFSWFMELSRGHQEHLCDWIELNYFSHPIEMELQLHKRRCFIEAGETDMIELN